MKLEGYYSSGEFAAKSHITKKTIRYYDEHNILKPSYVNDKGARFYTEDDFARLQQILFLKYLGFSLDEIKEMTVLNTDKAYVSESLHMQMELMELRLEQLQVMKDAIAKASRAIDQGKKIDWSRMLTDINTVEMDQQLKRQYQNSSNISARINLHQEYSVNEQGWFPWILEKCNLKPGMKILEIGCGDGSLWKDAKDKLPNDIQIILTDISQGMILDARKTLSEQKDRFSYKVCDAHHLHFPDESFDLVIANHVLFYCNDISQVITEVRRVLKKGGRFLCSTYGAKHMKEVSELVMEFDSRIALAGNHLYEKFGKENGRALLADYFDEITWEEYEDNLLVTKPEALLSYVLSCHGNQNRYIVDRYKEFKSFVRSKTEEHGFHITKEAGIFLAR